MHAVISLFFYEVICMYQTTNSQMSTNISLFASLWKLK